MKKILTLVLMLGVASRVSAAQTSSPAATDSAVTIKTKLYSLQESAAYFNNSFWVRFCSWLNKVVSQNWDHQKQLSTMHKVVMPVKVLVTNKTHSPVYLPVTGWATGFDYSYNPASLATVYPKQWMQFAVSGTLAAFGALVLGAVIAKAFEHKEFPPLIISLLTAPIAGAGAYSGYLFSQFWKARSTSNALRALQPRIVRTVNGKRVETQVVVKTVRDMSFYVLPGDSSFEMMLFVPRVNDFKLKVDVKTAA